MKRWLVQHVLPFAGMRFAAATALLLLATATPAQTGVRSFPPNAQRGTLDVVQPPAVQLDGKSERLSPGARIRGSNNILVHSGAAAAP